MFFLLSTSSKHRNFYDFRRLKATIICAKQCTNVLSSLFMNLLRLFHSRVGNSIFSSFEEKSYISNVICLQFAHLHRNDWVNKSQNDIFCCIIFSHLKIDKVYLKHTKVIFTGEKEKIPKSKSCWTKREGGKLVLLCRL